MSDKDNSNINNNLNRVFNNSIPDTVMFHPQIQLLDLRIYAIIKSFMDTHNTCFPNNKWIASKLDVYVRSIPRSMAKLEALGFIDRLEKKGHRYLVIKQHPIELKEETNKQIEKEVINDISDQKGCHTGQGGMSWKTFIIDRSLIDQRIGSNRIRFDLILMKTSKWLGIW